MLHPNLNYPKGYFQSDIKHYRGETNYKTASEKGEVLGKDIL